jgi:hypothetical protein
MLIGASAWPCKVEPRPALLASQAAILVPRFNLLIRKIVHAGPCRPVVGALGSARLAAKLGWKAPFDWR